MTEKRVRTHNKSGRPDNIVEKENELYLACEDIERELPRFLGDFFVYLRGNVLPATRLNYLRDIRAFFAYMLEDPDLSKAETVHEITLEEIRKLTAQDVNLYLDHCRKYAVRSGEETVIYENGNKTLARKKSSLSVLFKQLYREGLVPVNIPDGFDPIRVEKAGDKPIKALQDDEVMVMLDAVTTGEGLTAHQRAYWEKTKKRDKAILIFFLTYGLRLSELQQLNLSSFSQGRGEFVIFRKRGKESFMPMNRSVTEVLTDYVENERPLLAADSPAGEDDALFLSLQGKRMTGRQIRELVKKYTAIALRTSQSSGYSPHKLRATAATSLIGRGESIYDVAALLDHQQVTTTQLYARQRQGAKRDLVRSMEWEEERREGAPPDPEGERTKAAPPADGQDIQKDRNNDTEKE